MYYKSPFKRFLFRRRLLQKIRSRIHYYRRKAFRNEYDDIRFLFDVAGFEPRTIVDGGANIGFVTFQLSKRFKSSTIYSIEPNPLVFEELQRSFKDNSLIKVLNVGVSSVAGRMGFNVNVNTGTSSFLTPNEYHAAHLAKKGGFVKEVETMTLDDLVTENGLNGIDLLKLDVEGFELEALRGAERQLADQQIHVILLEVNLIESYVGQPLFYQVAAYLAERGYHAFNTYGMHESKLRQCIITNFVFLSGKFRDQLKRNFGDNCGW